MRHRSGVLPQYIQQLVVRVSLQRLQPFMRTPPTNEQLMYLLPCLLLWQISRGGARFPTAMIAPTVPPPSSFCYEPNKPLSRLRCTYSCLASYSNAPTSTALPIYLVPWGNHPAPSNHTYEPESKPCSLFFFQISTFPNPQITKIQTFQFSYFPKLPPRAARKKEKKIL